MADAAASKAVEGNLMGVQVPSPAFYSPLRHYLIFYYIVISEIEYL